MTGRVAGKIAIVTGGGQVGAAFAPSGGRRRSSRHRYQRTSGRSRMRSSRRRATATKSVTLRAVPGDGRQPGGTAFGKLTSW